MSKEIVIYGITYVQKKAPTYKTVFVLSMPNVGSWNGQWSGQGNLYCVVKPMTAKHKELHNNSYYYNFGDGWGASIKVLKVESKEASKMKKASRGFCGYDWMISSILTHGDIRLNK